MSSATTDTFDYDLLSGIIWNANLPTNRVTYYFYEADEEVPYHLMEKHHDEDDDDDDDDDDLNASSLGWTAYEIQQFELALSHYTNVAALEFVRVNSASEALLHLVAADFGPEHLESQGFFLMPLQGEPGLGLFNIAGPGWEREPLYGSMQPGGMGFEGMVHELGHAVGLAHPHDDGGGSTVFPGVIEADDYGHFLLNQQVFTAMSYNVGWPAAPHGGTPYVNLGNGATPMALDIAALQLKYGVNPDHNSDDTLYVLPHENDIGTFYSSIWDTGGVDTIVHQGEGNAHIDLRPATLLFEEGGGGFVSYVAGIHGGFTIAHGVTIENAVGGSGNDSFIGNHADNHFDGGAGRDTVIYEQVREHYTVMIGEEDVIVTGNSQDTLVNIERLAFDDGTLALDTEAAPGQVYRLYEAAFDREADPIGLGYWIHAMEEDGQDFLWVAENFVQSQEFTLLYGPAESLDAATYVALLYENALERQADHEGAAYWVEQLEGGMSNASVLAAFAESAEHLALTAEQTAAGVWYSEAALIG